MVSTGEMLIYSVLPTILGCILLGIFYWQGRRYNRYTPHFIISLLCLILSSSLMSLDILITQEIFSGGFYSTIALIFGSLSLYAYFRHYYAMNSFSGKIYQLYNYVTIATISLHIPQLFLIVEHPTDAIQLYLVQTTARFILYIMMGGYALVTAYENYKIKQTTPTKIEFIANNLLLISLTLVSIGNYGFIYNTGLTRSLQIIQLTGTFFGSITLVTLVGNYVANPTYILSLPIPVHAILIYNDGGLPVYSKIIDSDAIKVNDYLITNAFSAISSLISEALDQRGDLKQIDLQVYQIYFGSMLLNNKLCIIASGDSYFFKKSIETFLRSVPKNIIKKLNKSVSDTDTEKEIELLLSKSFPYLD